MEILIGLLVGLLFFGFTIGAYTIGVKHGKEIKSGGSPTINPVKIVEQKKAQKEAEQMANNLAQNISNLLNYGEVADEEEQRV